MLGKLAGMHLAVQVFIALLVGSLIGMALPEAGISSSIDQLVAAIGLIGQLWLRALQMTILPLVFALISTTFIRSEGLAKGGRTTRWAFAAIVGFYLLSVFVGVVMVWTIFALFPISDGMAASLRAMVGEQVVSDALPWADAVLSLIPANIVSAMSGGTLLPVLFFALLFGAAIARLEEGEPRRVLVSGLTGVSDAVFVIVGWVLKIAPLGVACLILPTIHQNGLSIFVGFAHYILASMSLVLALLLLVYGIVMMLSRVPLGRFSRAILPVQGVALGTQSSTGCMPLTISACRQMGISDEATNVAVPLSAVLFRMVAPASGILSAAYGATVYGLPFGIGLMIAVGLLGMLLEMGLVGIPGAAVFIAFNAPIAALVGFPVEFIIIFLVVETIPDLFKTALHVTGHAAAAAVVDRQPEATTSPA